MLVTFLRHGQSEHNAGLTAHLDSKLTPLGEQQAEATALRFRDEGFTGDNSVAFVSPFVRTLQTLEPIARTLNIHSELFYEVCEYFSERNDGYKSFEGQSIDEICRAFPWVDLGDRSGITECWWPVEQEDDTRLYQRACRVRDRLISKYFNSGKNIIIVSHADPIGRMIEAFLRVPPNLLGPPWSGNCAVTRMEILEHNEPARMILLNNLRHLTDLGLASPR